MNKLKRPESFFAHFSDILGEAIGIKSDKSHVYLEKEMDSFLSACAEKLGEARKLREEAEDYSNHEDEENTDCRVCWKKSKLLYKASQLENEVIEALKR